jgi:hypothetical protein
LTCGAGEGWRRSVGQIICDMKKFYKRKEERNNLPVIKEDRLPGMVTSCIGMAS